EAPLALCTLRPDLPPAIEEVCRCLLAKDPAQRFASAGELVAAYRACLRGQAPQGRSASRAAQAGSTVQQQATIVAAEETQILEAKPQPSLPAPRSHSLRPLTMVISAVILVGIAAAVLSYLGGHLPRLPATSGAPGTDQPPARVADVAGQPAPMTLA